METSVKNFTNELGAFNAFFDLNHTDLCADRQKVILLIAPVAKKILEDANNAYELAKKQSLKNSNFELILKKKNMEIGLQKAIDCFTETMPSLIEKNKKLQGLESDIRKTQGNQGKGQGCNAEKLSKYLSKRTSDKEKLELSKSPIVKKYLGLISDYEAQKSSLDEGVNKFHADLESFFKTKFLSSIPTEDVLVMASATDKPVHDVTGLSRCGFPEKELKDFNHWFQLKSNGHMERRLKLAKVALEVCAENAEELSHYKLSDQFKAIKKYGILKNRTRRFPRFNFEYAHTSLIPAIGIQKSNGESFDKHYYRVLNPQVELSKVIDNVPGSVDLTHMLNCTDYLPWIVNAIDEYLESFLRDKMVDCMDKVIKGSCSFEMSLKNMCIAFKGCLEQLKENLQAGVRTATTTGKPSCRFDELLSFYRSSDLNKELLKSIFHGMWAAVVSTLDAL